ncbi:hypothetical protein GW17_00043443 [Ensete ventricosum]|nr:hypothetical protein GW17_00043443 [Ensete ventricosum]
MRPTWRLSIGFAPDPMRRWKTTSAGSDHRLQPVDTGNPRDTGQGKGLQYEGESDRERDIEGRGRRGPPVGGFLISIYLNSIVADTALYFKLYLLGPPRQDRLSLIHLERVRGRINIMKLMEQGFKAASARLRSIVGMDAGEKELEALGQCRY